jgi:hypothetical protein
MISLLLSLVLAGSSGLTPETPSGVPVSGVATWYGARCPEGVTNYGRKDTCTPYKTVAEGGRGGERIYYAAVPRWRWGAPSFRLRVCRKDDPTRCVIVVARDSCGRCREDIKKRWTSRSLAIDLSPAAFLALAPLSRGVVAVVISDWPPLDLSLTISESRSRSWPIGGR